MEEVPLVLIVDDDPAIRTVCRVNLEMDGFRVAEAGSLAQARAELERAPVDVVLLDVHVGPEDGREFLAELRRERPSLPVALLTGTADRTTLVQAGADALVGKPFRVEELRETVERLGREGRLSAQ